MDGDFRAVQKLSVNVLHSASEWLLGDGKDTVRGLLRQIPADLDIWKIEPDEYDAVLGPGVPRGSFGNSSMTFRLGLATPGEE